MGNATNPFDFSQPLAAFLAQSIGDGTYATLLQDLKEDKAGEEGVTTSARTNTVAVWGNLIDDFVRAAYPRLQSVVQAEPVTRDTSGAVAQTVEIVDLASVGNMHDVDCRIVGRTSDSTEIVSARLGGVYYLDGTAVKVVDKVEQLRQQGLTGVTVLVSAVGTRIFVRVLGSAGKDIRWTITNRSRSVVSP